MAETVTTLRLKIDATGLHRGLHDVTHVMGNMQHAMRGEPMAPRKPYPRSCSRMTARQWRADRRRYARQMRAYRKTLKATPPASPIAHAFRTLAAILTPRREDFELRA